MAERTDRDEMVSRYKNINNIYRQLLVKAEQRCVQLQKDYIKIKTEYEV